MKNNKSLVLGLIGLAAILLVALYAYNEDQKRRLAEAEATEEQQAGASDEAVEADAAATQADEPADESVAAGEDGTADAAGSSTAETADADSAAAPAGTAPSEETDSAAVQTETAGETDKTGETVVDSEAAETAPASTAPAEPVTAPQFDIVRVEPDGSTVIAGQAKAGTTVEVVTGDRVLAESEVGQSGDFAAIFDDPLAPGDYEIVLRVVEEGDVVAQSEEVATVSVPEENPEQLLVIVTKPGEASRILTQPEAAQTASATGDQPTEPAAGAKDAETDIAAAPETASSGDGSASTSTAADEAATETETMAAKSDTESSVSTGKQETGSDTASAGDTDSAPASGDSSSQVAALADTDGDADTKNQPAPKKAEPAAPPADSGSTVSGTTEQKDAAGEAAAEPKLRIDAVEIEGGKIFVAGSATPGASVRVYADGTAIGDSPVSATGRFLVEAERDISVGQHTISADLMMPGSDAATMRVAVPFTRPAGETVAAVAAPAASGAPENRTADAQQEETDKPAGQTAMAAAETTTSTPTPATGQTAKADDETDAGSDPATPATVANAEPEKKPQEGQSAASDGGDRQGQSTETAAAETRPETRSAAIETETVDDQAPKAPVEKEPDNRSAMTSPAQSSSTDASAPADAVAEASDDEQMADAATLTQSADAQDVSRAESGSASPDTQVAAANTPSSEPETVVQQALEPKEGSVIIRRGDTLWQISRRVYGRGVRYTTIYLANSDQISNPDFIEPGQIFMVPNEPLSNAEQLHRERIKRR